MPLLHFDCELGSMVAHLTLRERDGTFLKSERLHSELTEVDGKTT